MTKRLSGGLSGEGGYSMVEVLVAIIILMVAIIPMFTMFDVGLRTATTSGNYDMARSLAEKQMELVVSVPYSDVEAGLPQCNGDPVTTPGSDADCVDGNPVYDGFVFDVEKRHLGFPPGYEGEPSVELEDGEPDDGMIEVKVSVSRASGGGEIFDTTGVVVK